MTVPFIRKSTQRNSSWPGDFALHPKAEYICADLSIASSLFPCSRAADHTFAGTTASRSIAGRRDCFRIADDPRVIRCGLEGDTRLRFPWTTLKLPFTRFPIPG